MPNYVLAKSLTLPKGTVLVQPAPLPKEPVTYAHAVIEETGLHFSIPLDAALQDGLIEEAE